jgi:hypothetical protein
MGSLLCCSIKADKSGNKYDFCSGGCQSYEHCWNWFWIIPACLVIGLPCLFVGLYERQHIIDNNNEIIALYNNQSILQHNTTVYQFAEPVNCRVPPAQLNITKFPNCAVINMHTQELICTKKGDCINEVCDSPCYYQCDSKLCKVKSQQPKCAEAMQNINCLEHFDLISTTYSCVINPISAISICQSECHDINCIKTSGKCYCKCKKYQFDICDITKNVKVTHEQYFMTNNGKGIYRIESKQCQIMDLTCMLDLNKLINVTYPETTIYYNSNNLNINTLSIENMLQQESSRVKPLIISGYFFTILGVIIILGDLWTLIQAYCSCYWFWPKCCSSHKPLAEQENEPICVICSDLLLNGDKLESLECKHQYHAECISKWKVRNGKSFTCPLCRKIYPGISVNV